MTTYTHQNAPTQFVEANGIRFAYRRFGKAPDFDPELFLDGIDPQYWAELNRSIGGVPLVFNQHFTGTMDHWDPAVTDGLAKDREVILFDNAGVSSSSGEVPTTFEEMGANAIAFIKALGLKKVDVLGFSIGGFVAQEITLQAPDLVRRLVLVGTGPRGGQNMAPSRRTRNRFSAPPTRCRRRSGRRSTSPTRKAARLPAANSSSASSAALKTAIPR
jgi:pimeloyl-ACP methyl ester carboxylesterase